MPDRGPANILLVDDQPANLVALKAILEPLGQNLVTASSGEEALKRLLTDDFAVILLDVRMPGMDGFETAEYMKRLERTRHVPIIFLTAQSKEDRHVFQGYEVGAVDYLFKPFDPTVLRSKVSVFVELHQKSTALETLRLEEQHARQLRALADASVEINRVQSLPETLQLVSDRAREITDAEQGSTWVVADDEAGRRGSRAVSLSSEHALGGCDGSDPAGPAFSSLVMRTREPLRLSRREARTHRAWEAARDEAGAAGAAGWLGAPLSGPDGRALGCLQVSGKRGGEFTSGDEAIVVQLAEMASAAIERVRLYEQEHGIAETLQRSLLPERLPDVPEAAVSARYIAGSGDAEVGGDWYDVIPLEGGAVGLALGDVVGRGIRAASVMGQLRNALRAYAIEGRSPADVAERLDRLATTLDLGHMTTFVYLVFDPEEASVRYTCAGHLPPLVVGPDGTAAFLEEGRSLPLGVGAESYAEGAARLDPGATVVLYTDGLVEERGIAIDEGLERLRAAALEADGDLEALCDHLIAANLAEERLDDVAVLALRALPAARPLRLEMPSDPAALAPVREALRDWLRHADVGADEIADITTAFGEACTNAVEHPWERGDRHPQVEATLRDGQVAITVRDFGRWRAPRKNDRGRGFPLMEALMDQVVVTPTPGGTEVRLLRRLRRQEAPAARV